MSVEMNNDFDVEETASERGMKWIGRVIAVLVVLVVAAFGDVMYIVLMQARFPDGLLLAICYAGAFTSFLAIVYMLIGKSVLFTPGPQMVFAWLVFSIELALIGFNLCLVFAGNAANGFLHVWQEIAPATPVFNMAGVAILYFLDEAQKIKHEDVEMSWEMKRAQRRHVKALAKARLRLQYKQLNFLVTELDRAVAAPESLRAIQQTAIDLNTYLLGQLSGGRTYRTPELSAPGTSTDAGYSPAPDTKIVDDKPSQPASAPVSTPGLGKRILNVFKPETYSNYSPSTTNKADKMPSPPEADKSVEQKEGKKAPKGFFTPSQAPGKPKKQLRRRRIHRKGARQGRVALASQAASTEMR